MRVPIAIPQRLKLCARGATPGRQIDDLIVTERNRTTIAWLGASTSRWSPVSAWFIVAKHLCINSIEGFLPNIHLLGSTGDSIPCDSEKPIAIIDLDFTVVIRLAAAGSGLTGFDEYF